MLKYPLRCLGAVILWPVRRAHERMMKRYIAEQVDLFENPLDERRWVNKLPFLEELAYDFYGTDGDYDSTATACLIGVAAVLVSGAAVAAGVVYVLARLLLD